MQNLTDEEIVARAFEELEVIRKEVGDCNLRILEGKVGMILGGVLAAVSSTLIGLHFKNAKVDELAAYGAGVLFSTIGVAISAFQFKAAKAHKKHLARLTIENISKIVNKFQPGYTICDVDTHNTDIYQEAEER